MQAWCYGGTAKTQMRQVGNVVLRLVALVSAVKLRSPQQGASLHLQPACVVWEGC